MFDNTLCGPTAFPPPAGSAARTVSDVATIEQEQAALVALLRVQPGGLKWPELAGLVAGRGSALQVWHDLTGDALFPDPAFVAAHAEAEHLVREWTDAPFRFLTFLDDDYPARLREVRQMPPVLFAQGHLIHDDDRAVSVVGSREASETSLAFAAETAALLVARGTTVVSGLAAGIDRAAHTAALEAGGRTVAVIGTGIAKYYPAAHRELQQEIASKGLVLSQFWPDAPPTKWSFPLRNATMSAYGEATVVVQAGEQSGARIQAREAVAHGRPVILAEGVVQETRWGAQLATRPGVYSARTPQEVLERLVQIEALNRTVSDLLALAPA